MQPTTEPLLTTADVARWLNLPVWTVRTYRRRGILPAVQIGSQIRFDPAQIRALLQTGAINPTTHEAQK